MALSTFLVFIFWGALLTIIIGLTSSPSFHYKNKDKKDDDLL